MEENGKILARAECKIGEEGFWTSKHVIEYGGNQYILRDRPVSWLRRFFGYPPMVLLHDDGSEIGSVERKKFGAIIDFPESIPIPLQILCYRIASLGWATKHVGPGAV